MKFGIGQPVRRREDVRLVTGRGRYTDDIALDGQAYAYFVRSPHAHARILSLDTSEAIHAPGVVGILTADDVAHIPTMPVFARIANRDGRPLRPTPKHVLPADKVRFCGEAVAMIVAESPAAAKDAAERVVIDYDPLPAAGNLAQAETVPPIWDEIPGNLALDWEDGDGAACDAAFAKAAKVVSVEVVQNRVMPSPMEPRGALATCDAPGHFTLYTGTQGGGSIRARLADMLGIAPRQLRVVTPDVGGGFGQKTSVTAEQVLVLLAAKKWGRPVKWIGERTEAFLADAHGRDTRTRGELALDGEARILAVRAIGRANLGAYMSQIGPNVATSGGLRILGGVYRVPAAHASVRAYITNCAPISAYRGAGRPEAAYLMERLLDQAAAAFALDRVEIRRRNLLDKDELPYKTWKGLTIDSGDFRHNVDAAVSAADWAGFAARRDASERRGKKRGIGIAYYVEVSGGPPGPEPAAIRFDDSGAIRVMLGTQTNGQGHATSFAQLVAERLGQPFDAVTVCEGDTDWGVIGLNTVGSRSLQTAGNAILRAADEVIRKGRAAAGHVLQAGGAAVDFAMVNGEGTFTVAGTGRSIGLRALAATLTRERIAGFENGLDSDATYEGTSTFPNGCHICEVEIDADTGVVEVARYTIADDMGRIVNPLIVEGQVHGGVAQGLGQALMEQVQYDPESGQLLTATLLDYALPRADDMPPISFQYTEIPCTTNPLGSKGAGEAGTVGALPVLISAVCDALGIAHLDMPATPERVWRVLHGQTA